MDKNRNYNPLSPQEELRVTPCGFPKGHDTRLVKESMPIEDHLQNINQ